jgi:hypothetical protein
MAWRLTVDEAKRFFAAHTDDTLINLWRRESMRIVDGVEQPMGSTCPLGVVCNVAGMIDAPGVCAAYWSDNFNFNQVTEEEHQYEIDPVLSRFVHLIDRKWRWSGVTGAIALLVLASAERDIAAGIAPESYDHAQ